MIPSITQDNINKALCDFLTLILPTGTKVIIGQTNRVPAPEGDYVVIWPLRRPRLATNLETADDTTFTASISTNVMTVTQLLTGSIKFGRQIFGTNIADNTVVSSQSSGTPGGAGVYIVSGSQAVGAETMSTGAMTVVQDTEVVMQVDAHGPASADNAQTISTIFRDGYAVDQMASTGVTPLYADDPRQMPFITAASQYEDRWMVDLHMQVSPIVSVPQQFADAVALTVVDVDVAFPPQ